MLTCEMPISAASGSRPLLPGSLISYDLRSTQPSRPEEFQKGEKLRSGGGRQVHQAPRSDSAPAAGTVQRQQHGKLRRVLPSCRLDGHTEQVFTPPAQEVECTVHEIAQHCILTYATLEAHCSSGVRIPGRHGAASRCPSGVILVLEGRRRGRKQLEPEKQKENIGSLRRRPVLASATGVRSM